MSVHRSFPLSLSEANLLRKSNPLSYIMVSLGIIQCLSLPGSDMNIAFLQIEFLILPASGVEIICESGI